MTDTPLATRLQLKGDRRMAVIGAPPALAQMFDPMPGAPEQAAEVVVLFVADRAALDEGVADWRTRFAPGAILWLAYPKLSSPLAADLSRDSIRAIAATHGLDTVAQIAIDRDWSALRVKPAP